MTKAGCGDGVPLTPWIPRSYTQPNFFCDFDVAKDSDTGTERHADDPLERCRDAGYLTTGEMARLSGNTLRTVRFYETEGLISAATRNCGGHRMFENRELQKLQLISDLRETGMCIADIRRLFELKQTFQEAPEAAEEMGHLLEQQVENLANKIAKLERVRSELGRMVESIRDCHRCHEPAFPKGCGDCSVMKQCGLPRAMKLLWK
ncbi:MAG: MerR family transcriptional regulator [Myxococcales bacterium]|nr:MerR family transcriptional regulator [Myxococcales bacterium]